MTLAERLSEYVARLLHGHLGPVVRARRRDRWRSPGCAASSNGHWPPGTSIAG